MLLHQRSVREATKLHKHCINDRSFMSIGFLIEKLNGIVVDKPDGILVSLLCVINAVSKVDCCHSIPLYAASVLLCSSQKRSVISQISRSIIGNTVLKFK